MHAHRNSGLLRTALPITAVVLAAPLAAEDKKDLRDPREVHLADVTQLTFQGENAEAYWSPEGDELILQARFPPHECDQIFRLDPEKPGELELVSTGKGRTTCAYFFPDRERGPRAHPLLLDPSRRRRVPAGARLLEGLRLAPLFDLRDLHRQAGRQRSPGAH